MWVRGGQVPILLRVGDSLIAGAGRGLFLVNESLEDGQSIGSFWGSVRHTGADANDVERWGVRHADDRSVMLTDNGSYHVVDVRGCVFEFMNSARNRYDANVHVRADGQCEIVGGDVVCGDELLWWYGDSFALP